MLDLGMAQHGELLRGLLTNVPSLARRTTPVFAALALSCSAQHSTAIETPIASAVPAVSPVLADTRATTVASEHAHGRWDVTVRNLNILHGVHCIGQCRLQERLDLAVQWLTRGACPDVITLQEVSATARPLVTDAFQNAAVCPFEYEAVYEQVNTFDDAMILSRYPVLDTGLKSLDGAFRHVLYARVDHPAGPVDVFTTHLASGIDLATLGCGSQCPRRCVAAGARTRRECQAVVAASYIEARGGDRIIVTGDFNAEPNDFEVMHFLGRGFEDTYSVAGNPPCDPATGVGCSSGRGSSQARLEEPACRQGERIDYVFVRATEGVCSVEAAGDPDADGVSTGALADRSNPFVESCGQYPKPPCWPSDHAGVEVDWKCQGPPAEPRKSASRDQEQSPHDTL
jgi:endonuclease/exonuclease/phosphatase family metal-dependent hydrolase